MRDGKGLTQRANKSKKISKLRLLKPLRQTVASTIDYSKDNEDEEIERLEKLLGIKKTERKKVAAKLNKEFEEFEGIGDNFGDFLMDLDNIAENKEVHESPPVMVEQEVDSDASEDQEEPVAPAEAGTYRPAEGEDIYGRLKAGSASTAKYTPPARRMALLNSLDESSEAVRLLRRAMNGLMNKLSEESKDGVVRSLRALFASHSQSVCSRVLQDCISAACNSHTLLMASLIPLYASVVAALHVTVGIEVGAFVVETLCQSLCEALREPAPEPCGPVSSKLAANSLLLLVYLYNLRVLHHTLVVDIMNALAAGPGLLGDPPLELRLELLELLVDHCGHSVRSDDPLSLKLVISSLTRQLRDLLALETPGPAEGQGSRLRFLFEALTDLKNNKSRRVQTAHAEAVGRQRRWLGSLRASLPRQSLRVTLRDLLDADQRGRWWRAGASWAGKEAPPPGPAPEKEAAPEQQQLLELAQRCRMNTAARRRIFCVLMSSGDVEDAWERLGRLGLRGPEDRELVRVLLECCGQERLFNAFYAELAKLLCSQNRQFKTSFQFAFWDAFKLMAEGHGARRRLANQARLLAQLVSSFHLPLSVIKPIDLGDLNEATVHFLSTFFTCLFADPKVSEEDFQSLLDRVATTRDFAVVRDFILFFLQKHLTAPSLALGLKEDPALPTALSRRRTALRTMEAMSVLDMSMGLAEGQDPQEPSMDREQGRRGPKKTKGRGGKRKR